MNRKLIMTGIVCSMLVLIPTVNALSKITKNDDAFLSRDKNVRNQVENEFSSIKIMETIDTCENKNLNREKEFFTGWIKVKSIGKGFHLIFPLKILEINTKIPTPQYQSYHPLKIKVYMFLTFIVYSDKNANTTITIRGEDKPFYKNGSHSLLVGMLKIPAMNLLRQLLDDGLIDGNQLFRRYCNIAFGLPKPPIALVLSRIVEKIFGGPIVDVPDSTLEFLRVLHGIEPRYNGSQIFDFPMINYLRDKLMESFPRLAPIIINQSRFFPFLFFSGLFWNRVPVRSSFLHFEMPQKLEGYTHFVWLSKQPVLLPFVKCVQNFIPDVFYDGRLKNN